MGRGGSKQKVQQAFLQRKWPLGGYLNSLGKRGDAYDSLQGRLAATDGPRASWDNDCGACCEFGLGRRIGAETFRRNDAGPFHNGMELLDGKIRECVQFSREGQRISTRSTLAGCSTRNVNEVRSATNNCRRCGPHHFAPFPLRLP